MGSKIDGQGADGGRRACRCSPARRSPDGRSTVGAGAPRATGSASRSWSRRPSAAAGAGMRVVRGRPTSSPTRSPRRQREAAAAFGDGTVFLERFVESPRHVEVQIFGDTHGTVVHLFERECSIQRRYQKVIEEAPSPAVARALRAELGEAAVAAAHARSATSARAPSSSSSTPTGSSVPRGQHPPPGRAPRDRARHRPRPGPAPAPRRAGRAAPRRGRSTRRSTGHAIEARLYAEDVAAGFLPAERPDRALRAPRRRRGPRRRRLRGRVGGQHRLRRDARQGDRLGADPRRGGAPAGRRARAGASSTGRRPTATCSSGSSAIPDFLGRAHRHRVPRTPRRPGAGPVPARRRRRPGGTRSRRRWPLRAAGPGALAAARRGSRSGGATSARPRSRWSWSGTTAHGGSCARRPEGVCAVWVDGVELAGVRCWSATCERVDLEAAGSARCCRVDLDADEVWVQSPHGARRRGGSRPGSRSRAPRPTAGSLRAPLPGRVVRRRDRSRRATRCAAGTRWCRSRR